MNKFKQVDFLINYNLDSACSFILAKSTMYALNPNYTHEMKCGGELKTQSNLELLSSTGSDTLFVIGLHMVKDDLMFALKHWKTVIIFDDNKDTEKYLKIVDKMKGKLIIEYTSSKSLTSMVQDWNSKVTDSVHLQTPEFLKLVTLVNTFKFWETSHSNWQDAYDLNDLFWQKNMWKFTKRFDMGYDKLKSSEKSSLKKLKKEKLDIIDVAPKKQCSDNSAVLFLSDSKALTLCQFEFPEIDFFYIIYASYDTIDFNLSIYARDGDIMREYPKMAVNDACEEIIKQYPKIFESYIGDQSNGTLKSYKGIKAVDIVDTCDYIDSLLNVENS